MNELTENKKTQVYYAVFGWNESPSLNATWCGLEKYVSKCFGDFTNKFAGPQKIYKVLIDNDTLLPHDGRFQYTRNFFIVKKVTTVYGSVNRF